MSASASRQVKWQARSMRLHNKQLEMRSWPRKLLIYFLFVRLLYPTLHCLHHSINCYLWISLEYFGFFILLIFPMINRNICFPKIVWNCGCWKPDTYLDTIQHYYKYLAKLIHRWIYACSEQIYSCDQPHCYCMTMINPLCIKYCFVAGLSE